MTLVLRADADGVATLTLNRPEKLNALNPAMFAALRAELDAVAADAAVRCVVLTLSRLQQLQQRSELGL